MKLPVDGHQRQVGALVPALPEVDGERGLSCIHPIRHVILRVTVGEMRISYNKRPLAA